MFHTEYVAIILDSIDNFTRTKFGELCIENCSENTIISTELRKIELYKNLIILKDKEIDGIRRDMREILTSKDNEIRLFKQKFDRIVQKQSELSIFSISWNFIASKKNFIFYIEKAVNFEKITEKKVIEELKSFSAKKPQITMTEPANMTFQSSPNLKTTKIKEYMLSTQHNAFSLTRIIKIDNFSNLLTPLSNRQLSHRKYTDNYNYMINFNDAFTIYNTGKYKYCYNYTYSFLIEKFLIISFSIINIPNRCDGESQTKLNKADLSKLITMNEEYTQQLIHYRREKDLLEATPLDYIPEMIPPDQTFKIFLHFIKHLQYEEALYRGKINKDDIQYIKEFIYKVEKVIIILFREM
jgi:hypothetical protein